MKIKIQTDLFFARAEKVMVRPVPIQLPAQWVLNFEVSFGGEYIQRSFGFPTKPTRRQIKQKRQKFKEVVDYWLYYI